eukprot:TRINITY_DN12142_c0_g2_i13.p3 TRINITY_DN12142_c0_g2~~TRINITY_DN12142_c0_g2_i13.p3  ORF type:complete len:126 (+),score=19.38 TRINITY_DN12142_c0_g2_i13:1958-2335(+)
MPLIRTDGAYTATVTLRNPSNSAVRAVPQLYTTYPDTAGEPVLQLKAFTSIVIGPKATTQVALELNNRSFSVWDVSSTSWKVSRVALNRSLAASACEIVLSARAPIHSDSSLHHEWLTTSTGCRR